MRLENKYRLATTLLLALFFTAPLLRAGDVLERRITVEFSNTPLQTALEEVARLGGFEWSYNSRILDHSRRVSLPAGSRSVRETLVLLLGDDYTFRQSGSNIILKRNKKPQQRLSGYLSDPRTGKKISNATVYDRLTLRSTTTDSSGFYELPVGPNSEIVISKLDYRDTVLEVTSQTPRFVRLDLYPDSLPPKQYLSLRRSVNDVSYTLEQVFLKTSQSLAALNVQDSLHRRFQLSLLPGIGTNLGLSGGVTNDFSINIIMGYSRGNRAIEVAGLANLTSGNMTGLQAAGVFNSLRGNAAGIQAAGAWNVIGDTLAGMQAAGVFNFAGHTRPASMQAAGALNFASHGRTAAQAAGVANQADTLTMLQVAGVWNSASELRYGLQVSGVSNYAAHSRGSAQVAGLNNNVRRGRVGTQVAGVANMADTLSGIQVSGFFNQARLLRGTQIGIVNIAGKNQGTQIGLFNFSGSGGYIALDAGANDLLTANISFRSGRPHFYVTLSAGVDSTAIGSNTLWAVGIGIGAYTRIFSRFGFNTELTHRHLSEGSYDDAVQEWEQLALTPDLRLFGGLHLFGGPSFNLLVTDPDAGDSAGFRSRIVRDNVLPADAGDGWLAGWWGWTAGVRWRF